MQSVVGGVYECGAVDLPQDQQGAHLMSLRGKKHTSGFLRTGRTGAELRLQTPLRSSYLAAGQVQGSVLVLIQQCQVSLGPVKEDG